MSVRLFVGNLPYSATEVDIRQHFGTVGDPMQVVIPTDRDTGRPRGFAFVDYDDRGVAERAIQQLHGQPFKGRPLSVSEARVHRWALEDFPRRGRRWAGVRDHRWGAALLERTAGHTVSRAAAETGT